MEMNQPQMTAAAEKNPSWGLWRRFVASLTGEPVGKKNAYCSFCRKSYRDVGPLVEGPGDAFICYACIKLCESIIDEERRRQSISSASGVGEPAH